MRALLSSGQLKTADECNQKPPAKPVVFAVSIMRGITIMQHPSSLLRLPPEWNQTPKDTLPVQQLFDDHLETPVFQHRHKLVIRCG